MSKRLRVAVATSSALAAEAAAAIADGGGNAVDCAIAASLIAMNTEPGVCALAGGAYVTIAAPGSGAITIDGGVAVPGKDLRRPANAGVSLEMAYGGGVETVVGAASVAVPGALAALDAASKQFGGLPWPALWAPVVRAAEDGFPLPRACHYYLGFSGRPIFARSPDGETALYDRQGELREPGARIRVPHLADSLNEIAEGGADVFYSGRLARALVDHVAAGGGALTRTDLEDYRAIARPALQFPLAEWRIACNPPPAIGGAMLAALLLLAARDLDTVRGDPARLAERLAEAQMAALRFRRERLDLSDDVAAEVARLLRQARSGALLNAGMSSATVHTSAVDSNGLACAITSSAGYGSGEMPAGTGLWLNNCLGELELNRQGLDAGPPGARLPSNMCPGVALKDGAVLAFGSPGADRITTALQQVLLRHLALGQDLESAVSEPRLHAEIASGSVSVEDGVDTSRIGRPLRDYPANSMYFGGVAAARFDGDELRVAADPRRAGGVYRSP